MTCFGYSSIKIDKYSNTSALDRGKVYNNFHIGYELIPRFFEFFENVENNACR